jgi:DNA (cytosine-5)-methyltransferase 1
MTYRVLDLFSGIGGFSLGLERTGGFETVAFCEISPVCRHLLNHHWPRVPAYDDVCALTAERLAIDGIGVDAICGGFPCQDISFAGKGAGLAGERSGLWREYARLIRELRPRFVFVENVAALLARGLGDVLGDLAALGYDAWWDCIPASAVGAPHRRDRLWLIAYARSVEHEGLGDALRRAVAAELSASDASGDRWGEGLKDSGGRSERVGPQSQLRFGNGRRAVADAASPRQPQPWLPVHARYRAATSEGQTSHAEHGRFGSFWATEPDVGRVAHGVPARVDRLHGLGNAVVPEIPYLLGKAVLTATTLQAEAA